MARAQSLGTCLMNQKVPKGVLNYLNPMLFSTNTKLHCLNKMTTDLLLFYFIPIFLFYSYFIPIFLSLGFWQKALKGLGNQLACQNFNKTIQW